MQRMSTHSPVLILPARLKPLAVLAGLLEKLERSPRQASAAQYRQVVTEIHHLLESLPSGTSLDKPLDRLLLAFPGTAEVYENLRYAESGLSRAPLDESISAEVQAAKIIEQARHRPTRH
jgi:hypothetical protein